ncbi:helix-turn-helix domain-containing protein [Parasutterella excrementihominis]|uniref:helix-turn-helix domain-containing protein n=1 Tax=Parasutterella excrementihominis TaxID=487175 RepID=UPI0027B8EA98|nr:helix-turn-helix domain-containing protein [Parasutterella excrementihominis]
MKYPLLMENLRYLMNERKDSANLVATSCGITASTLSRFLNGEIKSPRTSTIAALAKYFNLTPEELVATDVSTLPKIRPPVETEKEKNYLVPLVTGQGAANLYFGDLWPFQDDLHELSPICWLAAPPDKELMQKVMQVEGEATRQVLYSFQMIGSAMQPTIKDGDILYLLNSACYSPRDGDIVLVRRIKRDIRSIVKKVDEEPAKETVRRLQKSFLEDEADFLIRKLSVSDSGEKYITSVAEGWPEQEFLKVEEGRDFYDDQILGIVASKYSKL